MENRIFIGSPTEPDWYFDNDSLWEADVEQNVGLVGQNLSIDSFTAEVSPDEAELHDLYRFRSSDGHEITDAAGQLVVLDIGEGTNVSPLVTLEHGTPVWYYQDQELIGKFYIDSVERTGRSRYRLNCVSAIGLLADTDHGGGLFLASTFGAVLTHILAAGVHGTGDPIIDYAIDDDVAELPVSGWLPHDTKRNNLYRLIFATGVNIVKNADGNPRFTFLYPAGSMARPIDPERVYDEGSVAYETPYKRVVVLEHTYTPLADEAPVTLFDNAEGEPVTAAEVWFDRAPVDVSTLDTSGTLTVVSATENSAVLSGSGKLTGVPYLHDTRGVSLGDPTAPEEKTIRVEDSTFTNVLNSGNLLNRLYAFYCPADYIQRITNGIVWDGERCGKVYAFPDPFDGAATAFLARMQITASAVNKAVCEWYGDYAPAGQAGLYQHVAVLVPVWDEENEEWVYDGDWTVPEGVTEFKAVLIGGGTGGGSGLPGANGQDAYTHVNVASDADISGMWYGAEGGDGGAGGAGGAPARVKVVTVSDAVPGASYSYTLGQGGQGGAATGFRPDTEDELRAALRAEDPDTEYTAEEIAAMLAEEQALSDWAGSPNAGSAGSASTLSDGTNTWSTADADGAVPAGGVYEPIGGEYFALPGKSGVRGGKGGARKVQSGETYNWVTDGESVSVPAGADIIDYRGGRTGTAKVSVSGLPEAKLTIYGGNGAGAAVGLDRAEHEHMDGGSDAAATWEVVEDGT